MTTVKVFNQLRKVNEFQIEDNEARRVAKAIVSKAGYIPVEDSNSVSGYGFNGREMFHVSLIRDEVEVEELEDEFDGILPGDLEEA